MSETTEPVSKADKDKDAGLVWPPPPTTPAAARMPVDAQEFIVAGVTFRSTTDIAVVENRKHRTASIVFWAWQAIVLAGTVWVQYQSMLWFQNVWGFHGRAVQLEVGLQAIVWMGMVFAYVAIDWNGYNHYCRFRATFDRAADQYVEGARSAGPLARIMMIEVRRRSSLFAHWYEVRMLLANMGKGERSIEERSLATFAREADASRLADAVAGFLGIEIRRTG